VGQTYDINWPLIMAIATLAIAVATLLCAALANVQNARSSKKLKEDEQARQQHAQRIKSDTVERVRSIKNDLADKLAVGNVYMEMGPTLSALDLELTANLGIMATFDLIKMPERDRNIYVSTRKELIGLQGDLRAMTTARNANLSNVVHAIKLRLANIKIAENADHAATPTANAASD